MDDERRNIGIIGFAFILLLSLFFYAESRPMETQTFTFFGGKATVSLIDEDGGQHYDYAEINIRESGDWSLKIDYIESDDDILHYDVENGTYIKYNRIKDRCHVDSLTMTWDGIKEKYVVEKPSMVAC